jgi:hypothetical protein
MARHIMSVGSADNVRTDASNFATHDANSTQAVIKASGDGPPTNGRVKPDLVVPGADIQGSTSSEAEWPRVDLSATPSFPEDQKRYFWSSGSNPAVATVVGGAAFVRQWFLNQAYPPYHGQTPTVTTNMFLTNLGRRLMELDGSDRLLSNRQDFEPTFDESPQLLFQTGRAWTSLLTPVSRQSWRISEILSNQAAGNLIGSRVYLTHN